VTLLIYLQYLQREVGEDPDYRLDLYSQALIILRAVETFAECKAKLHGRWSTENRIGTPLTIG
jgi:hypothetical protein